MVVLKWVDPDVGQRILSSIIESVKEGRGIAPFRCAIFEIMARDVDGCVTEIRIALTIPARIQQRGLSKDLDGVGGRFAPLEFFEEDLPRCDGLVPARSI